MSGFEVIGVVLGIYPVVVNAYQAYTATKSNQGIESFIQRLRTEEIIYNEWILHLLGPNVSEAELLRLKTTKSTNPEDLSGWQDFHLQSNLTARLGFQKAHHILLIVKDMGQLLESMKEDIPGAGRQFENQRSKFRSGFRNFRHNLAQSPLKSKLDQLRDYNYTLQRLLSERTLPGSGGNKIISINLPQRDHSDAKHVYYAMRNAYSCSCDKPHFANLELPQIAPPAYQKHDPRSHGENRLQLYFPIADTLSNKAAISICECLDDRSDAIQDLCMFVKTFSDSDHVEPDLTDDGLGILLSDEKKYKLEAPTGTRGLHHMQSTVSLEALTSPESTLCRRDRISLALRLSYAILQYYSTGWIDPGWTWKDFSVAQTDDHKPDESHLFVTQKFYSATSKPATPNAANSAVAAGIWACIGEPILTRLGFALIELALGRRLSQLRDSSVDQSVHPDMLDFFTARNLLKEGRVRREEGTAYEDVVRACLEHQFLCRSEIRSLDSRSSSFHRDVEQSIIAPLHSMWTETWG